jgi:hypothetical protein
MLPIYWVLICGAIVFLFRKANQSNKKRHANRLAAEAAIFLTQENQQLRLTLAQVSMDHYALKTSQHHRR